MGLVVEDGHRKRRHTPHLEVSRGIGDEREAGGVRFGEYLAVAERSLLHLLGIEPSALPSLVAPHSHDTLDLFQP